VLNCGLIRIPVAASFYSIDIRRNALSRDPSAKSHVLVGRTAPKQSGTQQHREQSSHGNPPTPWRPALGGTVIRLFHGTSRRAFPAGLDNPPCRAGTGGSPPTLSFFLPQLASCR